MFAKRYQRLNLSADFVKKKTNASNNREKL